MSTTSNEFGFVAAKPIGTVLIDTATPMRQPAGVDWDRVQPDQYEAIPFLKVLREKLGG